MDKITVLHSADYDKQLSLRSGKTTKDGEGVAHLSKTKTNQWSNDTVSLCISSVSSRQRFFKRLRSLHLLSLKPFLKG